jgi:hypothetical protein
MEGAGGKKMTTEPPRGWRGLCGEEAMKKRTAEKIISRSILALKSYRKSTMNRALRRRPRFWTVAKPIAEGRLQPPRKRLRLEFGETKGGFSIDAEAALVDSRDQTETALQ